MSPPKCASVEMCGGLGNQLFQIATLISYTKKYNLKPILKRLTHSPSVISPRAVYWDNFLKNVPVELVEKFPTNEVEFSREPHLVEPSFELTCLVGYFQNPDYFSDLKNELPTYFRPLDSEIKSIEQKFDGLLQRSSEIGVIHIRRGDYLLFPNVHPVPSLEYYRKGIEITRQKGIKHWIVFSDDYAWVQQQSLFQNAEEMTIMDAKAPDYLELYLMSRFRAFILANSTFGWWAAYLSPFSDDEKQVIVPKQWFGPGGPSEEMQCAMIPKNWQRL